MHKLMNNTAYGKAIKNLRNWNNVKLVKYGKDYLKRTPKPSSMSHKIFDNNST